MGSFAIFLSISESWSSLSAGQFFSTLHYLAPAWLADTPTTDSFRQVLNVLRYFGATIFVAWLAWFFTKRMVASRGAGGRESCNLAIVESISVGGQAVVRLVRAGDKYLLVGVTKERVTLLGEVDKEQIVEQKAPDLTGLNTPFSKVLSRFMGSKEDGKDE